MGERIINRTLVQRAQSNGEVRTFEIYNEKFIKILKHTLLGDINYHLSLDVLTPWPVHHRRISWRWLMSLVYFFITTGVYFIYLLINSDTQTLIRLLPFLVVFTLLLLGSLLLFLYYSPNVIEFRSRYGNCTLISLLHNKPNKKEFKHFTDELKTRVLAAGQSVTLDKKQMLEIECNELQRLKKEGVLNEDQCAAALERIEQIMI